MVDLLRVHLSRTVGELREDFWGRRQHWVARAPRPECPLSPCAPVQRGRAGAARPSGKPWALEPQIMRSDAKSQKIASSFPGITCFLSPTIPARGNASSCKIFSFSDATLRNNARQNSSALFCLRPQASVFFSQKVFRLLCSTYDFGREGRQGSKVCQCPYQFVCHSRRGKEGRSPWRPGISSRRPHISDPPCSR